MNHNLKEGIGAHERVYPRGIQKGGNLMIWVVRRLFHDDHILPYDKGHLLFQSELPGAFF